MVVVNLYSPRTKNAFSPLLRKTVRTSAASVHGAGPCCLRWLSGMDELAAAMEVAAVSLDSDFEEDLEQPSTDGHPSQVEGATPTEEDMAEDKENQDGDAAHCQPGAADPQVINCFPVPICTPSRPPVAMLDCHGHPHPSW